MWSRMRPVSSYHHGNLRAGPGRGRRRAGPRPRARTAWCCARWPARPGVSHNAAYRHFADRDALLAEVAALGDGAARARRCSDELDAPCARRRPAGRGPRPGCARPGGPTSSSRVAEPGLFEVAFAAHRPPRPAEADAAPPRPLRPAQPGARRGRRRRLVVAAAPPGRRGGLLGGGARVRHAARARPAGARARRPGAAGQPSSRCSTTWRAAWPDRRAYWPVCRGAPG